ncbi:mitochondrial carrier domain-containing protein [Glomus cerebriforme]|uniref:Mitochondrial carrier domain-containing protein n=1 Tax=Glomus cerebriforme TaxID=658196 RepID=A0A397TJF8_9GLOM|nr:mitochondrial carrier domain-containing protein [Glomus cerebriforme]
MDTSALETVELENEIVNNIKPSFQSAQNNMKDSRLHATPLQKLVAACSGALLTSLFTTPFDVVKTRLQSQSLFPTSLTNTSCCSDVLFSTQNLRREFICQLNSPHISSNQASTLSCTVADAATFAPSRQIAVNHFNGSLDGMIKIVRNEGITSLWRGLSPALVMSIPVTVIYFVGYDYLRDSLWTNWKGKYSETYSPLIAGASARTIAATVISPLELFRTRMQGPEGVNGLKEVMKGIQKMAKVNGVLSLWRGLEPSLYRDVPFSAIYWTGYELTKRYLTYYMRENNIDNKFAISFLSGATSGSIAAALTTPFDVAKTRRQVSLTQMERSRIHRVLKQIYQEEGFKGLFTGGPLRISKVAVSCAIMISTYEALKVM